MMDSGTVMNPNELRFSQKKAGAGGRTQILEESMKESWDYARKPADAVQVGEKLVTFDNTGVGVAQELGVNDIKVKIHQLNDPLPGWFAATRGLVKKANRHKLPIPKTWGEALKVRTKDNGLPLEGSKTIELKRQIFRDGKWIDE